MDPVLVSLVSALGGAGLVAWVTKRVLDAEIKDRVDAGIKSSIENGALNTATRGIVETAIEKERAVLVTRFATREDFARVEGKIDSVLATLTRAQHGTGPHAVIVE